jgi:uncharacterized protein (TIGR00725 family)
VARVAVAVVGAGQCDDETAALASEIGKLIAERGAVLITGGSTGVMEAASRGAHDASGLVIGILADGDARTANPWVDVAIPTGMGQLRNGLIVNSAGVVIAVDGEWGTLSEIALARKIGKPVVGLHTWRVSRDDGGNDDLVRVDTAREAVDQAFALLVRQ